MYIVNETIAEKDQHLPRFRLPLLWFCMKLLEMTVYQCTNFTDATTTAIIASLHLGGTIWPSFCQLDKNEEAISLQGQGCEKQRCTLSLFSFFLYWGTEEPVAIAVTSLHSRRNYFGEDSCPWIRNILNELLQEWWIRLCNMKPLQFWCLFDIATKYYSDWNGFLD